MKIYKLIGIFFLIFLALAITGQAQIINGTNCLFHFNLDPNSAIQYNECSISKGGTRNATVSGATWTGTGIFNGSYGFSAGTNKITYNDQNDEKLGTSDFALCAWFNNSGAIADPERLIGKAGSGSTPCLLYTSPSPRDRS